MKASAGFLALLFLHAVLAAQQPDAPSDNRALAGNPPALSMVFNPFNYFSGTTYQSQTPPLAQNQKPKPAKKEEHPKQLKRTRIDASMVGYIEDSAVQTQVRVRFDAGFNDPRPDRAEYFYAGSTSPGNGAIQRTLNFQELYLNGEYAPLERFSAFVQVPFRWIQPFLVAGTVPPGTTPAPPNGGGISDVQGGLRFAAIASASRNLTFQLGADFPTGNGDNGLGTNHYSIEPKILLFQRLSDRTAIEAEAGDSHPIGGTVYYATPSSPPQNFAADVAMYGIGPSYELIKGDRYSIAPVLELVSWHVFGGLQTGSTNVVQSAGGINVLNAKLGARASFSNGSSIYAGFGRGLTSDIWYRNLFRIEYRRVF
jgi:hypothetical protein